MTNWYAHWTDENLDWEGLITEDNTYRYDREKHEKQRIERGFSDYDAWSFDAYIAVVLANYMKWQRKFGTAYPDCMPSEKKWHKKLKRAEKAFAKYNPTKTHRTDDKELQWALKFFKNNFVFFWG